jgi:hypothetical protein
MKPNKWKLFYSFIWIVFYLAVIDVMVNIIFQFPKEPEKTPPSFLEGYFEYGRSVEGKLDRMARRGNDQSAPILGYGWLENKRYESLPKKAGEGEVLVAVYGMSHIKILGNAIAKIDSKYVIRNITGPGVPPGWSFAAYRRDKNLHEAKVVILGIMTDSIPFISATSGATSYFDMSHPYTFPRYFVQNGLLKEIFPPFYTEEGFREYLYNPIEWAEYRDWLSKNDKFYNAFLFERSLTDRSALFRVLRRSYSQKIKDKIIGHIYTKDGFNSRSEEIVALRKIVKTFAKEAREEEKFPIVYIVNNQGRGDHLYRALKPVLEAHNIPFLSTHIICPPDDPRVFMVMNSHFIPSKDMELAREMIKIIEGWEREGLRGVAHVEGGRKPTVAGVFSH